MNETQPAIEMIESKYNCINNILEMIDDALEMSLELADMIEETKDGDELWPEALRDLATVGKFTELLRENLDEDRANYIVYEQKSTQDKLNMANSTVAGLMEENRQLRHLLNARY